MSFRSSVTVEIGDKTAINDFTDRVQGAQIVTRLRIGDFGTNRAILTLRNDDGALTPGGGGTYGAVDWFSQAIFIEGDTGNYQFTLFHGMITGFDLQDDGVNSTVTIEADDGLTVGGSSATEIEITGSISAELESWLTISYNGFSDPDGFISGAQMPTLNNSTSSVDFAKVGVRGAESIFLATSLYSAVAPVRDFVRTVLMPSGPNIGWPTTIDLTTSNTNYKGIAANINPIRASLTALTFTLDESPSSGELPFRNLSRGYPADGMLNEAVMTTLPEFSTGTVSTVTSTDVVSRDKYGTRAVQASSIMVGQAPTSPVAAQEIANRWAHTYSSSEFVPRSFEITEAMVVAAVGSSSTSEQAWSQLLDVSKGPLQQVAINFTPTGALSQQTESVITMSRTISVVPGDIRLTVECLPLDQAAPFILDSSTLGVLDTNRLG